jgi:hypothetical protein
MAIDVKPDFKPTNDVFQPINHVLAVDGLFWDRDSHGLFDFDSKILVTSRIQITGCSIIARNELCEMKHLIPLIDKPSNYHTLLSTVYRDGKYWLYNSRSLF